MRSLTSENHGSGAYFAGFERITEGVSVSRARTAQSDRRLKKCQDEAHQGATHCRVNPIHPDQATRSLRKHHIRRNPRRGYKKPKAQSSEQAAGTAMRARALQNMPHHSSNQQSAEKADDIGCGVFSVDGLLGQARGRHPLLSNDTVPDSAKHPGRYRCRHNAYKFHRRTPSHSFNDRIGHARQFTPVFDCFREQRRPARKWRTTPFLSQAEQKAGSS